MAESEEKGFIIKVPVDLKDVEEWEAKTSVQVPAGRYDGVIVRVSKKAATEGGAGMQILPVYAILGTEYDGMEIFPDNLSLGDKLKDRDKQKTLLGKFKQFMLAATNGKADHGAQFRSSHLVGKNISFEVYMETYEGQPRMKFRNYKPYDADDLSPGPRPGASVPMPTDGGDNAVGDEEQVMDL